MHVVDDVYKLFLVKRVKPSDARSVSPGIAVDVVVERLVTLYRSRVALLELVPGLDLCLTAVNEKLKAGYEAAVI